MEAEAGRNDATESLDRLNGWMTLNSAANELEETRYTVLVRCVAKQLEGQVLAGQVLVSVESIERVKRLKQAA